MRAAFVALMTIVALMTSAMAQPRKVLVLPLDGNAAQRGVLNDSVAKLAKDSLGSDVTIGDTTFNETASAVGCDPQQASCADLVRTTLSVDELVYGAANTTGGTTTVTVSRMAAGDTAPKTQVSVIGESDPPQQIEGSLTPLFSGTDASGSATEPVDTGSGTVVKSSGPGFFDTTERKLAVALGAGAIISLAIGLSMWSGASGLQDDIDAAPRSTLNEIEALRDLEDRAASKALWGNVFVAVGLVAAGAGGYFLWQDRKARRSATIAPAPVETGTGMTFVLRGRW